MAFPQTFKTPTSTPTPQPVLTKQPISLRGVANAAWDEFGAPPQGNVVLGEVPFNLLPDIFKSQAEPSPNNAYPTRATVDLQLPRAQTAYLLVTAGNAFSRYNGMTVGEVRLTCGGGEIALVDLELGRTLREWHTTGDLVTTASETEMVWRGAMADFPDLMGHIDMLTLSLPAACREGTLASLSVLDLSAETVGSRDPALNFIGLTVAYYP